MSYYAPAELRAYLIAQGIVRLPDTAGPLPSCYVDAPAGCPYGPDFPAGSAQAAQTTLDISEDGGTPTVAGLGAIERVRIRIDVRSSSARAASELCRAITEAVDDTRALVIGALRTEWIGVVQRPQTLHLGDAAQGHLKTLALEMALHRRSITP